jgi:aspartate/glutamate racemase
MAGSESAQMQALWKEVLDAAVAAGADAMLIACSEINALGNLMDDRIAIADATPALAQATVRRYLEADRVATTGPSRPPAKGVAVRLASG